MLLPEGSVVTIGLPRCARDDSLPALGQAVKSVAKLSARGDVSMNNCSEPA